MEKSAFLREQGNTPVNRLWNFLIVYSEFDYSMKDIARHSRVSYSTLKYLWKEFKEKKLVVQTRVVGKAKMYRLNEKNPVVRKFKDYYWAVVDSVVRREYNIPEKESLSQSSSPITVPVSAKHI